MPQSYAKASVGALPSEVANAAQAQLLSDEHGMQVTRDELRYLAEAGAFFKACNPTLGTGIAMGIQTAFSDTANVLFVMRNGSTTKKVIPLYLRLICTAAGSTTTSSRLAIVLDTANRYASGGTDLSASVVNANSGLAPTTAVDVLRYSCTAAAASAKRQVANMQLKTATAPCWVVGDEVIVTFGSDFDMGALSGTAASVFKRNAAPIVLEGQNHCMLVHMWNPANATTAPSWEFELGWVEK
jgi:hypothetical protein